MCHINIVTVRLSVHHVLISHPPLPSPNNYHHHALPRITTLVVLPGTDNHPRPSALWIRGCSSHTPGAITSIHPPILPSHNSHMPPPGLLLPGLRQFSHTLPGRFSRGLFRTSHPPMIMLGANSFQIFLSLWPRIPALLDSQLAAMALSFYNKTS